MNKIIASSLICTVILASCKDRLKSEHKNQVIALDTNGHSSHFEDNVNFDSVFGSLESNVLLFGWIEKYDGKLSYGIKKEINLLFFRHDTFEVKKNYGISRLSVLNDLNQVIDTFLIKHDSLDNLNRSGFFDLKIDNGRDLKYTDLLSLFERVRSLELLIDGNKTPERIKFDLHESFRFFRSEKSVNLDNWGWQSHE